MQDYKYYIEINNLVNSGNILQSEFFDTAKKATEWASSIMYLNRHYNICLMRVEWDKENEEYGDKYFVRYI